MKNVEIKYSRSQVNKAGRTLVDNDFDLFEYSKAIDIIDNWRSAHNYPINTFQATLRSKVKVVDPDAIVAQRLKRLPSIQAKLLRQKSMNLSRMQDIGGLRAIVKDIPSAYDLERSYLRGKFKHEFYKKHDYIDKPKESGYRSIHLVYKYKSNTKPEYDGILIEIQIRTRLQHAWATTVETIGTFLSESLKSSEGPNRWLSYLKELSSLFAMWEGTPICESHLGIPKHMLIERIKNRTKTLNVEKILSAYKVAVDAISEDNNISYYLLRLKMKERRLQIKRYTEFEFTDATEKYKEMEKEVSEKKLDDQVVLVSANSILQLKQSYPNYFVDTDEIIKYIKMIQNDENIYL